MGAKIGQKSETCWKKGMLKTMSKFQTFCIAPGACRPGQHGLGTESAISLRAERVVLMQPYFKFQKLAV